MIDVERNIIFIHPPKTGGSTVEAAFGWTLRELLGSGLEHKEHSFRKDLFLAYKHKSLEAHINYVRSCQLNPEKFFKVACIRNPWDILVSYYFMAKARQPERCFVWEGEQGQRDFEKFWTAKKQIVLEKIGNYIEKLKYKDQVIIDYIIRYENYKEDCERLFALYGVTWPKENYGTMSRPIESRPYSIMYKYAESIKHLVESKCAETIKEFGYTFED